MRIIEAAPPQRASLAVMKTSISFTTGGVRDNNISKPWQCFPTSAASSEAGGSQAAGPGGGESERVGNWERRGAWEMAENLGV